MHSYKTIFLLYACITETNPQSYVCCFIVWVEANGLNLTLSHAFVQGQLEKSLCRLARNSLDLASTVNAAFSVLSNGCVVSNT